MSYFKTKKGSVEEAISGVSKHIADSTYQDKFKKELDKAGKGIASMSDQEKKAFFDKIDKSHKAKNESVKKEGGPGSGPQDGDKRGSYNTSGSSTTVTNTTKNVKSFGQDIKGVSSVRQDGNRLEFDTDDGTDTAREILKKFGKGRVKVTSMPDDEDEEGMKATVVVTPVKEDLSLAPKGKGKEAAKKLYAKEGGVKDYLMDLEDEAAEMSLKSFLKKHSGGMADDSTLKSLWNKVNEQTEEYDINEKYVMKFTDGGPDIEIPIGTKSAHDISKLLKKKAPKRYPKYSDKIVKVEGDPMADKLNKRQRTHVGEEKEIEVKGKDLPDSSNSLLETVTSVWNMAAEEQEKREKEATYFKTDKKEDKDKKKAMTGSKASKVDTEPEVDFDSK